MPLTSGYPKATASPANAQTASSVTTATAIPRRPSQRCSVSDERIQQQGDEPGDDQQQDHAAQPVDDLASQVGEHDNARPSPGWRAAAPSWPRPRATTGPGGSGPTAIRSSSGKHASLRACSRARFREPG